jgi:transcriptional regulator with XRE-family HTH domain
LNLGVSVRTPGIQPPTDKQLAAARRGAERARQRLREDIERLCADAGLTLTALARAAGIAPQFLHRIMAGEADPSLDTYAKLAVPLGADLSVRLYTNTGPTIRDRHQARIFEALLRTLNGGWRPHAEVSVWKPVHGAIDAVLHDRRAELLVATEIESDMRRIEQTIRWSKEKTDALPSWTGWPGVIGQGGSPPRVSQLLIVRRTRANRAVASEFGRQLASAYPAHPEDALAALCGEKPWPGSALVWARIDKDRVRFLSTR